MREDQTVLMAQYLPSPKTLFNNLSRTINLYNKMKRKLSIYITSPDTLNKNIEFHEFLSINNNVQKTKNNITNIRRHLLDIIKKKRNKSSDVCSNLKKDPLSSPVIKEIVIPKIISNPNKSGLDQDISSEWNIADQKPSLSKKQTCLKLLPIFNEKYNSRNLYKNQTEQTPVKYYSPFPNLKHIVAAFNARKNRFQAASIHMLNSQVKIKRRRFEKYKLKPLKGYQIGYSLNLSSLQNY